MCLTEFDEEEFKRVCHNDGYIDGRAEKAIEAAKNLLRMNKLSYEEIAQAQELPLEKVQELAEEVAAEKGGK